MSIMLFSISATATTKTTLFRWLHLLGFLSLEKSSLSVATAPSVTTSRPKKGKTPLPPHFFQLRQTQPQQRRELNPFPPAGYESCYEHMAEADTGDKALSADEYARFVELVSPGGIYNVGGDFLALSFCLVTVFISESCSSCYEYTHDTSCCDASAAVTPFIYMDPNANLAAAEKAIKFTCEGIKKCFNVMFPPTDSPAELPSVSPSSHPSVSPSSSHPSVSPSTPPSPGPVLSQQPAKTETSQELGVLDNDNDNSIKANGAGNDLGFLISAGYLLAAAVLLVFLSILGLRCFKKGTSMRRRGDFDDYTEDDNDKNIHPSRLEDNHADLSESSISGTNHVLVEENDVLPVAGSGVTNQQGNSFWKQLSLITMGLPTSANANISNRDHQREGHRDILEAMNRFSHAN